MIPWTMSSDVSAYIGYGLLPIRKQLHLGCGGTMSDSEDDIFMLAFEPYEAGKQDAEKVMQLLEGKRAAWEAAWAERRSQLEQCLQRCQFDCDLKLINSQLSDLGKQLAAIRGQYGESLATAQATSLAFVYFEKTIEDQLTPPLFTRNLVPSTAKEGSSYQLECCVSGNPLPTVQWFKNDICIDASPDYAITYNNGEAILRFEEVFLDDQAEYKCCATNCVGSEETKAKLTVE
ncbi:hypothetical protein J437_LFUL019591, partial [Ladona fulva]